MYIKTANLTHFDSKNLSYMYMYLHYECMFNNFQSEIHKSKNVNAKWIKIDWLQFTERPWENSKSLNEI